MKKDYNTGSTNALISDESKNLINYQPGYSSGRNNNQNSTTLDPNDQMKIKDKMSSDEMTPRMPGGISKMNLSSPQNEQAKFGRPPLPNSEGTMFESLGSSNKLTLDKKRASTFKDRKPTLKKLTIRRSHENDTEGPADKQPSILDSPKNSDNISMRSGLSIFHKGQTVNLKKLEE